MNEAQAALTHLVAALSADDAVAELVDDRIYYGAAPEGAAYPFVLISPGGGTDRRVPGADSRIMSRPRWLILAVHNENDLLVTGAIAAAVDAALLGSTDDLTVNGQEYRVQSVFREEPVERVGTVDGVTYVNSGGYYRTQVHKL